MITTFFGSGPFRRAVRIDLTAALRILMGAPPTVSLPGVEPWLEAENGRVGRVRSPAESAAVGNGYRNRDRWRMLSGPDRVQFLRKLRAEVARERGLREAQVTREQLAKAAGVPPGALGGLMLALSKSLMPF